MRLFRGITLVYMTWLLAWFIPAHTRGMMTMGPRDAQQIESCCSAHAPSKPTPTPRDRKNCAVCFVALGILPVVATTFDLALLTELIERCFPCVEQVRLLIPIAESLARGPPGI